MATANAKLRDATEQLRDVLLHRLRSEARIAEMEKRLAVVNANRQKYAEGRMQGANLFANQFLSITALSTAGTTATRHTSNPGLSWQTGQHPKPKPTHTTTKPSST